MVEPITDLDPDAIRARLDAVAEAAGERVEILVATKYVPVAAMGTLAQAGVTLVGENRLQDLEAKAERWGELFRWDFIGALQSRKVPRVAELASTIHSLASDSALQRLEGAADAEVLVQVNVSGETSKAGIEPAQLGEFIARCPRPVSGLSVMPPLTGDPESSRPHFARLAELAAEHGLRRLSMGTSQDWRVAVEEGATTIRLGAGILRGS